ncbi:hypothetical protein TD95_004137 [Thielaviopsis punctulata]|uniref:Sec39 domain-containing protein n=1 Tax=Thielaviopsis punctulata TaxID=72032 RepID=A0A0F4ZBF5_9PEZI|nr:hypothetical protein TD95_004137 [Thielaviopsis punctulata]
MSSNLSNSKLVLLAIHLASSAHLDSLASLVCRHVSVLRKDLVLRILLTFLPETVPPAHYVPLLKELNSGVFGDHSAAAIDGGFLQSVTEEEAIKKVRRVHLLPLVWDEPPVDVKGDLLGLFLLRRAYRVDEEAGLLNSLPDLLVPFFDDFPQLRLWFVADVLPLIRRNFEYHPTAPAALTLAQFQALPPVECVDVLLAQTGTNPGQSLVIGRDLRGLIGPWMQGSKRWVWSDEEARDECPAFGRILEWLTAQVSKTWPTAIQVVTQWAGPKDVDLGAFGLAPTIDDTRLERLQNQYVQASLACAYLVPENTIQALRGVHEILARVSSLVGLQELPTLEDSASDPVILGAFQDPFFIVPKLSSFMRNDLLSPSNPLTSPSSTSIQLLQMLSVSAFLLTHHGIPQTIKTVGDVIFFADSHGQERIVTQFLESVAKRTSHNQEADWKKAREELLWLRSWGDGMSEKPAGVLGAVEKEFIEKEFLKSLLESTRHYSFARSIYEESSPPPLDSETLQQIVLAQAMNSYDHATNPHRMRGGLKKCDEIVQTFPHTMDKNSPEMRKLEALLKATHALSEYRLVLKQGEIFRPIMLRVHSDPVSILEKVLEQNPKSYTKLQDFLDIGFNMVNAGICQPLRSNKEQPEFDQAAKSLLASTERRVIAMCVEAALKENDFETAYSYVVNRLASASSPSTKDSYAWKAALQAGKYKRTAKSIRPTHVGTGSINPDIRHLEQRIECLSAALRIAPAAQLQEILSTFRSCEDQLAAALAAEAASEAAWDAAAETAAMPGSFGPPAHIDLRRTDSARSARSGRSLRSVSTAASGSHGSAGAGGVGSKEPEETMTLFDLSRATARMATRNFTALSGLRNGGGGSSAGGSRPMSPSVASGDGSGPADGGEGQQRARKRDQLREAAVGTLVSGVGWLLSAPVPPQKEHREEE